MPMMPPDPTLANCTVTLPGLTYAKGRSGAPVRVPGDGANTCRARATKASLASPEENGTVQSVEVWALCLFTADDPAITTRDPVGVAWDGTDGTVHGLSAECNSYAKWAGAWGVEVSEADHDDG